MGKKREMILVQDIKETKCRKETIEKWKYWWYFNRNTVYATITFMIVFPITMLILLWFTTIKCPDCGKRQFTSNYCEECGEPLVHYCSKCGVELANEQKFCKICGQEVVNK